MTNLRFPVWYRSSNDKNFTSYDGYEFKTCEKRPYGLELIDERKHNEADLKAYHEQLMKDQIEMLEAGVKPYIRGGLHHRDARMMLLNDYLPTQYKMTKGKQLFSEFPKIRENEAIWLESCSMSPNMYGKPGTYHSVKAFDKPSFYPTIIGNKKGKFQIPVCKGVELTFESIDEILEAYGYFPYGIYRMKITYWGADQHDLLKKTFCFSKNHHYTHIDVRHVFYGLKRRFPDMKMELINDGKPNFLYYGKRIKCSDLFNDWYNALFYFKKKHPRNKLVKEALNSWGYLCRENHVKNKFSLEEIESWPEEKRQQYDFIETEDGMFKGRKQQYCLNIARMKPFLKAEARRRMFNTIKNHIEYVIRVYVDGIICTNECAISKTTVFPHDPKYHGKDVQILNSRDVVFM